MRAGQPEWAKFPVRMVNLFQEFPGIAGVCRAADFAFADDKHDPRIHGVKQDRVAADVDETVAFRLPVLASSVDRYTCEVSMTMYT